MGNLSFRPSDAWPNARDVIHQQMNVASIRRAYEGGLRLMFASTTDDQVIAALLSGPSFVNGFVPDPESDFRSAKAQLELIQEIVEENANWMWIARTPKEARDIIHGGRLAIVLSVEMNGLSQSDLDTLVHDFGVQHVIPIHLIDNDVGGTAVNSDLFNAASATVSELYRGDQKPMGYMDVKAAAGHPRSLGWPEEITSTPVAPVYVGLQNISYPWYAELCYEPLGQCGGAAPASTSFIQYGQQNYRGLCTTYDECARGLRPGSARIAHMMDQGLFIDLSHMGDASVLDTLAVTPSPQTAVAPGGYPLIASHGDIAHLCDHGTPADPPCVDEYPGLVNERALDADSARQIVARQGVLGLGTSLGNYLVETVLEARGGPLLTVNPSSGPTTACVAAPVNGNATPGCEPVPSTTIADATVQTQTLQVETVGGISGTGPHAYPFVRVELQGPNPHESQHHVLVEPLVCSTQACAATVNLGNADGEVPPPAAACAGAACTGSQCSGNPYSIQDILSVTLQWLYLGCDLACQQASNSTGLDLQCQSSWNNDGAPHWTINEASVVAQGLNDGATTLAHVGPRTATPLADLGQKRGTFTLYQRTDRVPDVPAHASGHLLRVTLQSGAEQILQGANTEQAGANVCVAVRSSVSGVCVPTPPPASGATECPTADGWVKMNQRGTWAQNTPLFTFVRFAGPESAICGVDVAVLDGGPSSPAWTIDEVKVEVIEDPVRHWIHRYAEVTNQVAHGQMGTVAFGTDFNGLNGTMDISEAPVPPGAVNASSCLVTGGSDAGEAGESSASDEASAPDDGSASDDGNASDEGGLADGGALDGGGRDAGAPGARALAPMRFRNQDGTLGGPVLIDERGLATYGLLADFLAIIDAYPGCGHDVRNSLMLSAEATLRTWEAMVDPTAMPRAALPTKPIVCPVTGTGP